MGLDNKYSGNMTTIELREQMNALKNQQKLAKKEMNKVKKDYEKFQQLIRDNIAFRYITRFEMKFYGSFEDMVQEEDWTNTEMDKIQFEMLFQGLGFRDVEFFTAFMAFDKKKLIHFHESDRNCPVCFERYNRYKPYRKFTNCQHICCVECYVKLPKTDNYRCCVICRQSEA